MGTLAALGNLEAYFLTLIKCFETIALDSAEVDKYIVAFVSCDESITLRCVKPFYCAIAFQGVASQQEIFIASAYADFYTLYFNAQLVKVIYLIFSLFSYFS